MQMKPWRLALSSLLLMNACATTSVSSFADPMGVFQSRDINLREQNYAAADYLADRAKNYVGHEHTIKAMPLLDVGEPRIVTRLGSEIAEIIGSRLNELGYQVDLSAVNTNLAPSFAPTPQVIATEPDFILAGSYREKNSTVDITVTIRDAVTGQERASYFYTLARVGDVRKHAGQAPAVSK